MTLHPFVEQIRTLNTVGQYGHLRKIMPTWLEADGPNVPLGSLCEISPHSQNQAHKPLIAEVVRVDTDSIALVPLGDPQMLSIGAKVTALTGDARVGVGDGFLGRAVDALGQPIDQKGPVWCQTLVPLIEEPPLPLARTSPEAVLSTGVKAIDALLTLGRGQRIGIFAASGVGKTTLTGQLIRQIEADVTVTCLIGERGREVEALWTKGVDEATRQRMVLVAATSDQPAALRVRAVYQALAFAQHWRAQGKHVLFVLDSVTRFAMALRETGLAAGEPPTIRAYPPSIFSKIPKIVEYCGALRTGGSVSAVMTILSETDDNDDPICELMKSLLDGHIILSRERAERGIFPAIDVARSVSRNAEKLMSVPHKAAMRQAHAHIATYEASRTLIESGLYTKGGRKEIDDAIAFHDQIEQFLTQEPSARVEFEASCAQLIALTGGRTDARQS